MRPRRRVKPPGVLVTGARLAGLFAAASVAAGPRLAPWAPDLDRGVELLAAGRDREAAARFARVRGAASGGRARASLRTWVWVTPRPSDTAPTARGPAIDSALQIGDAYREFGRLDAADREYRAALAGAAPGTTHHVAATQRVALGGVLRRGPGAAPAARDALARARDRLGETGWRDFVGWRGLDAWLAGLAAIEPGLGAFDHPVLARVRGAAGAGSRRYLDELTAQIQRGMQATRPPVAGRRRPRARDHARLETYLLAAATSPAAGPGDRARAWAQLAEVYEGWGGRDNPARWAAYRAMHLARRAGDRGTLVRVLRARADAYRWRNQRREAGLVQARAEAEAAGTPRSGAGGAAPRPAAVPR